MNIGIYYSCFLKNKYTKVNIYTRNEYKRKQKNSKLTEKLQKYGIKKQKKG